MHTCICAIEECGQAIKLLARSTFISALDALFMTHVHVHVANSWLLVMKQTGTLRLAG